MPLLNPPPPTGAKNTFRIRQIFQNFQSNRSLTGNEFSRRYKVE